MNWIIISLKFGESLYQNLSYFERFGEGNIWHDYFSIDLLLKIYSININQEWDTTGSSKLAELLELITAHFKERLPPLLISSTPREF